MMSHNGSASAQVKRNTLDRTTPRGGALGTHIAFTVGYVAVGLATLALLTAMLRQSPTWYRVFGFSILLGVALAALSYAAAPSLLFLASAIALIPFTPLLGNQDPTALIIWVPLMSVFLWAAVAFAYFVIVRAATIRDNTAVVSNTGSASTDRRQDLSLESVRALLIETDPLDLGFIDDEYDASARCIFECLESLTSVPNRDELTLVVSQALEVSAPSLCRTYAPDCELVADRLLALRIRPSV